MEFIPEHIDEYVVSHSGNEPEYLHKLYRETHLSVLRPRMLSGRFQGRTLSLLSKLISPKIIVEVGTYTGYSALCLAEGLAENGKLYTLDNNEELVGIQQKFFKLSPYADKIIPVVTNALDYFDKLPGEIDLVFIDADKENYLNYYNSILPKMRKGGCIIADNVLWSGKVTVDAAVNDEETRSLVEFNTFVQNDDQVENVMLPIRDGLMIIRKK